jgi:hypothetical protein
MGDQSCINCKFWSGDRADNGNEKNTGHCRLNPPVGNPLDIPATEWCGQWVKAE